MSLAIQFQLKSVRVEGKQGGVVSDKKADTHSKGLAIKIIKYQSWKEIFSVKKIA